MLSGGVGSSVMRARMRISIFFIVVVSMFSPVSVYSIDADLNSTFSPGADGRSVSLSNSIRISDIVGSRDEGHESAYQISPYVWGKDFVPVPSESAAANGCDPKTQAPSGTSAVLGQQSDTGVLVYGYYRSRSTGDLEYESYYCLQAGSPAIPSFVPQVPTYAQIWNAIYSEAFNDSSKSSGAYIAPYSPGLTGLPSNIWAEFPSGQTISRDVALPGGFRVQATAEIDEVSIFLTSPKGNKKTLARLKPGASGTINGGSFENPATIHIFSTKGSYLISTGIIWTAHSATLSGPNIGTITVPLGSIRLEINREYEVGQLLPGVTK